MTSRRDNWPRRRRRPSPTGRVPRPFFKWLAAILKQEPWVDSKDLDHRIRKTRRVAEAHHVRVITDKGRHWRESAYLFDYEDKGPTILAGCAGNPNYACTAILHELGHHVLRTGNRHPRDPLEGEEAAWQTACDVAQKYRLPLIASIRRQALYTYRLAELLHKSRGAKHRNRRHLPKSWKMQGSQRSRSVSAARGRDPIGKKGRRHAKRIIKRATSKVERRTPIPEC